MRHPWTNFALLFLVLLQIVSGYYGFINGDPQRSWILSLHGIGGYAITLALFWKGAIILDVYAKRQRWRWWSNIYISLFALLLMVLISGLVWTIHGPFYLFGFSLITIHVLLAILLSVILVWHVLHYRWVLRVNQAKNRRAFLSTTMMGLGAALIWRSASLMKQITSLAGASRRFTGSYEIGSFSPRFPEVSWIADKTPPINTSDWTLLISGAVDQRIALTYQQLLQFETVNFTSILDCTGGWYTEQTWIGIPVKLLLDIAVPSIEAKSIKFESTTGYNRSFSLADASTYLLATHVANKPLSQGHGYPLRLVAPGQRGVQWVKWVKRITVSRAPAYLQPPLPLQ